MSRHVLKSKKLVIAELSTTLDLPITYILHRPVSKEEPIPFKISVYLTSDDTDIPICMWCPDGRGCFSINNMSFYRKTGLIDVIEDFCKKAYEAWKE